MVKVLLPKLAFPFDFRQILPRCYERIAKGTFEKPFNTEVKLITYHFQRSVITQGDNIILAN